MLACRVRRGHGGTTSRAYSSLLTQPCPDIIRCSSFPRKTYFGKSNYLKPEKRESQAKEPVGSVSKSKSNPNMPAAKGSKQKVFHVLVFSSLIGQWENREFTPGPSALEHLYDVVTAPCAEDERTWWTAEY
jgi:hypothetical protein